MNNPYSTPNSTLTDTSGAPSMDILPRFSAWGVFGLTVITFGFYYMYWLYTRTAKMNAVLEKKIPMWLVYASLGTYCAYIGMNFIPDSSYEAMPMAVGILALTLAYMVFYYWWLYSVRAGIHTLAATPDFKVGPILTFFFQPIYLQYKINQFLDQQQS
jgi:hypothetical protein